ncbi:MAG: allantoate amidohydrolase [Stappiaceae bacterium]
MIMNANDMTLGSNAQSMIDRLAEFSSSSDHLTRLYLSTEHQEAAFEVARWMQEAGLTVSYDAMGTVRGFAPATATGASNKRLLIGSHIDTVVNAGKFDGTLGVIAAILALEQIKQRGVKLPFGIDVLAFGDEEGVRFPSTLLSSTAIAGGLNPEVLKSQDRGGISVAQALEKFEARSGSLNDAAYDPSETIGYLEVHIEQGPVLETEDLPLGIVTAIAGASRIRVTAQGAAGHAGTVPMSLRHDALTAASELILEIETIARANSTGTLVATVGEIETSPGAVNVISSETTFSLDIRAAEDVVRRDAIEAIENAAHSIGAKRGCVIGMERFHNVDTRQCDPGLQELAATALSSIDVKPHRMMSGAGHDGQAVAALTNIGMLFVRCRDGISHNPLESVTVADMDIAVEGLIRWIEAIAEKEGNRS